MAYINGNKVLSVDLVGGTGLTDQEYNPESENAQSGKAVAEAVKEVEKAATEALNATAPYDAQKIGNSIDLVDGATRETLQAVRGVNPSVNAIKWDGSSVEPTEGSGTEQDPYVIDTPAKLAHIVKQYNANKHYVITNDFDLSEHEWISSKDLIVTYGATGFSGTIDGRGHSIAGLTSNPQTADKEYYTGLIPKVASGGTLHIKNLQVRDANIHGPINQGFASGILVGYAHNCKEITLINCYTDGTLCGKDGGGWIGGGTANTGVTISKCSTNAIYDVTQYGGAIADSWSNKYYVNNCYVRGKLFGNANFSSKNIVNCFATEADRGKYATVISEGTPVENIGLDDVFVGEYVNELNYSYIPMPKVIYTIPFAQSVSVCFDEQPLVYVVPDDEGYINMAQIGAFTSVSCAETSSNGFVYSYGEPLKKTVEDNRQLINENKQSIDANQLGIANILNTATNMKIKVDYYNYETTQEFEVEPNTIYFLRGRESGQCWHSKPDGTDKYARRHVGLAIEEIGNGYARAMALEFEKDPPDYNEPYFSIWPLYAITPSYKRKLGFTATTEAPVVVLKIYNEPITAEERTV